MLIFEPIWKLIVLLVGIPDPRRWIMMENCWRSMSEEIASSAIVGPSVLLEDQHSVVSAVSCIDSTEAI